MNSTVSPDAVLSARADERLAHAYEQIARADDELTRVTERLSRMENDAGHRPAAAYTPVRPRRGSGARGLIAFVLTACIAGAAFASHSSYGEGARQAIAPLVPEDAFSETVRRLCGFPPLTFASSVSDWEQRPFGGDFISDVF